MFLHEALNFFESRNDSLLFRRPAAEVCWFGFDSLLAQQD